MRPMPGAVTAAEAEQLVGLTRDQAQAHAQEHGYTLYVTGTDGVLATGRANWVSRRVRVALLDDVVVAVRPG